MTSPLHRTLADLARDHGRSLFGDAAAFRGALDDYLDEGQASGGTINLLTDAVRLGALDGLMTMLNSGAAPVDAVESAGQRLARDRGSSDVRGCQWAVAVLGYALGRVPEPLAAGLAPDLRTAAPPTGSPPLSPPTSPPMSPPTAWPSPPQQPAASPPTAWPAPPQQPATSPPTAWPAAAQQPGTPPPPTGPPAGPPAAASYAAAWTPPPARPGRGNTAFIASAIAVAVVVIVVGVIAIVALAGGDEDPSAGPSRTASSSQDSASSVDVPDIGGPVIAGTGYTVQVPDGWTDGTADFTSDNPDLGTLDRVAQWGPTFATSRGNLIIETQSAFGSEDPEDLADTWRGALVQDDDTATTTERPDRSIAGRTALTVEIARTNDAGVQIHQRSHLVINGDTAYSLTITGRDGDDDVITAFDQILSTWQWTD